jgi:nucleotide-binding universal stress UspA family protein
MFEKVLVPLDGSEVAEAALPWAEELAGRLGSEVTLVHVNEPPQVGDRTPTVSAYPLEHFYMKQTSQATKQRAERYVDTPARKAIKVESVVLGGNVAEEIVKYADEEDINLIVMATHGRSGVTRWALGSVAEKVVRATRHPVMLIRAKGARPDVREKGVLNKILVPLDGSENSEVIVPCVVELASKLKLEVVLLHVLHVGSEHGIQPSEWLESLRAPAEEYIDKVAGQLKKEGIPTKAVVRKLTAGTMAEEIIEFADEMHADVVAMSTHGRSGIGRWVFGSVTDRVLRGGNTPILLVRPPGACIIE